MSDADDQTGGSGDPRFEKPAAGQPEGTKPPKHDPANDNDNNDDNDNDVMTDDDLPSGG
jgi:hypothetical protein